MICPCAGPDIQRGPRSCLHKEPMTCRPTPSLVRFRPKPAQEKQTGTNNHNIT